MATKIEAYENGDWEAPAPPVCTDSWTGGAWVDYIDAHGEWTVDVCDCGGDGCYECMGEPPDGPFDTTAERDDFYS